MEFYKALFLHFFTCKQNLPQLKLIINYIPLIKDYADYDRSFCQKAKSANVKFVSDIEKTKYISISGWGKLIIVLKRTAMVASFYILKNDIVFKS